MLKVLSEFIYSPKNTPNYSFISKIENEYVVIDSQTLSNSKELDIIYNFKRTYYRVVLKNFLLFCLEKYKTKIINNIINNF